jgi:predicted nuclease of restriction endonuclease-like (RecB) superfamily
MEENNNKIRSSENKLYLELSQLIEQNKNQVVTYVNSTITLLFWQVGKRINEHILQNKRAEYGKQIVSTISEQLVKEHGRSFTERNLRRMMQFADDFADIEIVTSLMTKLSWTHFLQLLPLKTMEQKLFYAGKIADEKWSVRQTQKYIEQKTYERQEIANLEIASNNSQIKDTFKDPYFLDFLGLKDGYLEKDLETAIIRELENFILELGKGFTFVERQKRIILDGKDFYLDLLFFHRKLKRLIAIELKLSDFKPAFKGQMELYLKWLDRYEKQEGEESPIGLILCAGKSNEQIELLELHKDGIMVAEYWTELPPKKVLEEKLHKALIEARENIEKRKLL